MDGFYYTIVAIAVCTGVAQLVYALSSKRNSSRSIYDHLFWRLVFASAVYAAIVLAAWVHLPRVGTPIPPDFSGERTEEVVQKLVRHQQEMSVQLRDFKDMLSLVLMATGFQVIAVLGIFFEFRRKQRRLTGASVNPRPLGLELD